MQIQGQRPASPPAIAVNSAPAQRPTFQLAPLPYRDDALAPTISPETMRLHYGKHHKGYIEELNRLVAGTPFAQMSIEQVMLSAVRQPEQVATYNNAAQAWNHDFYWRSLSPQGGGTPAADLAARIKASFGTLDLLKKEITTAATTQFGSGWVWLVLDGTQLRVVQLGNAGNPLTEGLRPLLSIDVWEHAYYVDYENRRAEYVKALLEKLINWNFAAGNLGAA
jgi:Fe-Mn family superoxide dismutase